jgi:hypothetical protein
MTWRPLTDRSWRRAARAAIHAIVTPRTWPASYENSVEEIVLFLVSRVDGAIKPNRDCVVTFERVPLSSISRRNAARKNDGMAELIRRLSSEPGYDSIPLVLARNESEIAVWDGHHRMRSYERAGRSDIPALVASFKAGDGLVSLTP